MAWAPGATAWLISTRCAFIAVSMVPRPDKHGGHHAVSRVAQPGATRRGIRRVGRPIAFVDDAESACSRSPPSRRRGRPSSSCSTTRRGWSVRRSRPSLIGSPRTGRGRPPPPCPHRSSGWDGHGGTTRTSRRSSPCCSARRDPAEVASLHRGVRRPDGQAHPTSPACGGLEPPLRAPARGDRQAADVARRRMPRTLRRDRPSVRRRPRVERPIHPA